MDLSLRFAFRISKLKSVVRITFPRTWILATCLFFLVGCTETDYQVINGTTMGTYYSITYRCPQIIDVGVVDALLSRHNRIFSTYDEHSTISSVNESPLDEWIPVEVEFVELLERANGINQLTHGAFDVTVYDLIDAWGFGRSTQGDMPTDEFIETKLRTVGHGNLQTRRSPPGLLKRKDFSIDLSGIAKGNAVDRLAEHLLQRSCSDFLIDIGGEIRVSGSNPEDEKWVIGIERADGSGEVAMVLELVKGAVASSGDYRNFRMVEGQKFSHIIDPRTGRPITHSLVAVTVVAGDATMADGLATGMMVMGREEAMLIAEKKSIPAVFFERVSDDIEVSMTSALTNLIQPIDKFKN